MRLNELIRLPQGVTAVIGSGGKTSLIFRLARELSETNRVLIATTTHMWPPDCRVLTMPSRAEIAAALRKDRLLMIGAPTEEGKLGPVETLKNNLEGLADYVLVEADGSRGRPLKAPAEYEPVFPKGVALTIAVAGMNCFGETIAEAAHRPGLYAGLTGARVEDPVTPEMVASVLTHPEGQRKGVVGRYLVVLNQADTEDKLAFARSIAERIDDDTIILALKTHPEFVEYYRHGKIC